MGNQDAIKAKVDAMKTTVLSLVKDPAGFFREMPTTGGYVEPLIFMVVMSVAAAVIRAALSVICLGNAASVGAGIAGLIVIPVYVAIFGFVAAAVLAGVWRAMGAGGSFESAYRVLSYASIALPAMELFAIIPVIGIIAGMALGMYLVVMATIALFETEARLAWYTFGVIFAVIAIGMASAFHAQPTLNAYHQQMDKQIGQLEELTPEAAGQALLELHQEAAPAAHHE